MLFKKHAKQTWLAIAVTVALLLHLNFSERMPTLSVYFTLPEVKANRCDLQEFEREQALRLMTLEDACKRRNMTSHIDSVRGIAIKSLNIFYCQIPKVGMTTLKRILYMMENNQTGQSPFAIEGRSIHAIMRRRPPVSVEDLEGSDRYWKFIFVRDPYRRLFSAYIDKLFILPNEKFYEVLKMQTRNKVRCFSDVTFTDAVEYVLGMTNRYKNVHFLPQHDLCPPCTFRYDFIGKFETYRRDIDHILTSLNANYLPGSMDSLASNSDLSIIRDLIRITLEPKRFNCHSKQESFKRIWKVLQIRGILSIRKDFPLNTTNNMSSEELRQMTQQAYLSQNLSEDRSYQREMAYKEAYRSIPMKYLYKLKEFFTEDCELFGYDCEPEEIFQRNSDFEALNFFNFNKSR